MNGIVLQFEGGYDSGAFEDGHDGTWTAEAQRGGVPYAEGSGGTPLNAVMALAQRLDQLVSAEWAEVALARVDDAVEAAAASLSPDEQLALAAAKQRLAERRAQADE